MVGQLLVAWTVIACGLVVLMFLAQRRLLLRSPATVTLLAVVALAAERRLGIVRSPLIYPPLELARGIAVAALWPLPLFGSAVEWQGHRLRIGRRTLLAPGSGRSSQAVDEVASDEGQV